MKMNRLVFLIKESGFTQETFANKVGLTRTGLVRAIEKETIKLRDLKKIAEVLNITIENLFQSIYSDTSYLNQSGTQVIQEGNSNSNKINSDNEKESKCKIELKHMKEKLKVLEQTIEDKNKIIKLLEGK